MAFAGSNRVLIIHDIILFMKFIYDVALNAIEDHHWAGDWIYANFQSPVQATKAKRLEKRHILQCSDFR